MHKAANHQGLQSGAAAPNVQDVVPQGEDLGLPPEIQSLIDNLPPEVLEQVLAAVESEMQEAQGGGQPQPDLQEDPNGMVAKTAAYKEGFFEHARELNFSNQEAEQLYKRACDIMGQSVVTEDSIKEKQAHYVGFMERADELGLTEKQALDLYAYGFGN